MAHTLKQLFCGRLYNDDGRGYRDLDPESYVCDSQGIAETIALPGFCEKSTVTSGDVTYESHHFWLHFLAYRSFETNEIGTSRRGVLIRVRHGGGWELWEGDYMLADALARYGDDKRGLFKLCWYLIDTARERLLEGERRASYEHRKAFVDGRLRKRKQRGSGNFKVWIEPENHPA